MSDGRTYWWAKDAAWYDREANVILISEFGAEGTTVIDVLSCQAKLENNGGHVKTGFASLTRKGGIQSEETTRAIVARAVELGALDDFSEDRLTFTARVSGWQSDQELIGSAERQRRYREKLRGDETSPTVTVTSPASPITKCRTTGQDRTGQDRTGQDNNQNSNVEPRLDDPAIVSELFAYWQQQCGHTHAKLTADRRSKIQARLKEGYKPEQVRTAIDGAARAAFVDNGKRFDDIELICRSGSKLEDFISRATSNATSHQPAGVSEKNQRSARRMAALERLTGGHA